ncbi:MAG: hypothetical protein CMI60_02910 [Parvibaculum sp.]|nr:hypothetical protein [Parvibaculum sp.]
MTNKSSDKRPMSSRYAVEVLPGGSDPVETPDDFFKLPFVMLSVAKRMSGKTCSMSQFLHILNKMGRLDRVILVSPTYENNKHYFKGLPLNEEEDVLEPTLDAADKIMRIVEEEARVYQEFHEQMKLWREIQRLIGNKGKKGGLHAPGLVDDVMQHVEKPTHKYGGRKPVVVAFFDDCQNTAAFSTKSSLSYMTIKHRHIGKTSEGSIGVSLMYACQNYTSASGGIPKTIRGNTTILCVFKNKNMKELDIIAEECSGEVDVDTFMAVHEAATEGDYSFLTIDLNRKSTHPSMFRKCWNEWITAQVVPSIDELTDVAGDDKSTENKQTKKDKKKTRASSDKRKRSGATPERENPSKKPVGGGPYTGKQQLAKAGRAKQKCPGPQM